jgi:hypothetical protein
MPPTSPPACALAGSAAINAAKIAIKKPNLHAIDLSRTNMPA